MFMDGRLDKVKTSYFSLSKTFQISEIALSNLYRGSGNGAKARRFRLVSCFGTIDADKQKNSENLGFRVFVLTICVSNLLPKFVCHNEGLLSVSA